MYCEICLIQHVRMIFYTKNCAMYSFMVSTYANKWIQHIKIHTGTLYMYMHVLALVDKLCIICWSNHNDDVCCWWTDGNGLTVADVLHTWHLNHMITFFFFKQSYAANGHMFYIFIWDCFTETTDESEGEIKLRPQETRKGWF